MSKKQISKISSLFVLSIFIFSLSFFGTAAAVSVTADSNNRYPSVNVDADGDGQPEWIMEPNLWNVQSGSGSCTMTYTESTGNVNVQMNIQNIVQEDPNGWVHAYPEIWYGAKGWNTLGPANDGPITFPKQLSQLNDFSTRVQYSVTRTDPNLPFDFCYETWLTQTTSRGSIGSNDVELMIWLTYSGLQGFGSVVGSITVGGLSYNIYRSDAVSGPGWEGFAFLPTSPADSATRTIQWGPFIQEAASRSRISNWGNLYFTAVELGSEMGSPSYLSAQISYSLTNYKPSTVFTVLSGNILGGGGGGGGGGGDTTPPSTPTGLTATATSTSQINLNWNDNTQSDLAGYRVYRSTSASGSFSLIASPTSSQYSNTGLSAGTTYYYRVSAIDTSGNESPQTSTISATTQSGGGGGGGGQYQDISIPFTYNGAGEFYWRTTTLGSYINSWNLQLLTINGVDFTNRWATGDQWPWGNNLPAKQDGYYYIHYIGNYAWSHFEAKT